MKLTIKTQLLCSTEQLNTLNETLAACNAAANVISIFAFENKTFSRFALQKELYHSIREQFPISAQCAVRAFGKVADSYRNKKRRENIHKFRSTGAFPYDARILTFFDQNSRVSIWSLKGRLQIPLVLADYQKQFLQYPIGECDLFIKKGIAYLLCTVDVPEAQLQVHQDFLGCDLGIVNLLTDSDGTSYSGKIIDDKRNKIQRLRSALQSKGTKSAKRHLKKLKNKEKNFRRNVNHVISKMIVKKAKDTQRCAVLEKLKNVRKLEKKVKRSERSRHSGWAFAQLRNFIEYKARLSGVPFVLVNPKNTSRECSRCHYIAKSNRKSQSEFLCGACGHKENADVNASRVIAHRALVDERKVRLQSAMGPVNDPIVSIHPLDVLGASPQPCAGGS